MKKALILAGGTALSSVIIGASSVQAEESGTLPVILVESVPLSEPEGKTYVPPHTVQKGPASDGGDLLRNVTGVSGVRMGGHGIDPVIRGQSQTRLNILLDGAYIHGGCPNRMDPPTAYAPIHSYDTVTVVKGSQTVKYGGGGSGGSVLLERNPPTFAAGETMKAELGYSYDSNPDGHQTFADLAAGNNVGFIRGNIHYGEANNYEDGDGNEVRTSYRKKGANVMFGITPDVDTLIQFSVEANREDNVLYAGAMMDAPMSDSDTYRIKFEREAAIGPFSAIKAELYSSSVDHLMDNYTLRTATGALMRTPTESDTWGGRLSGDIAITADSSLTIGVDHQDNSREAILHNDTTGTIMSHMWADASLRQTGIFAEYSNELTASNRLDMGLRYDRVEADLGNPNAPGMRTPNQMFQLYYGTTAEDQHENNIGGFIRLKHAFAEIPAYIYASASRSVRTADATERYMAKWVGMANMRWVGNPDLDPEKHHQLELGVVSETADMNISSSIYYNDVDDFILYDRAHGQDSILLADSAVIYRNIDAELYGLEFEIGQRWGNWSAGFTLAYTHAQNKSDHRPIAQIPPLEGSVSLDYTNGPWSAGGVVRAAAQQSRVDDNTATGSGLDSEKTPGWGVLDLHAGYKIKKQWQIEVGVKNLFDKDYAQHLNKASSIDAGSQVDEPGRSFWVSMNATF